MNNHEHIFSDFDLHTELNRIGELLNHLIQHTNTTFYVFERKLQQAGLMLTNEEYAMWAAEYEDKISKAMEAQSEKIMEVLKPEESE